MLKVGLTQYLIKLSQVKATNQSIMIHSEKITLPMVVCGTKLELFLLHLRTALRATIGTT